jgi:hypothetical protein
MFSVSKQLKIASVLWYHEMFLLCKQQETVNVICSFMYARRPHVLTKCITMY